MIRTAVKIAYLGEHFSGSQIQPGCRTVEGDVLSDLRTIMKMPDEGIDLRLASRTDRGVNSLGNVAVFNSIIADTEVLLKALNSVSKDIYYRSAAVVDEGFNPRFADARVYRYIFGSGGMNVPAVTECAELFVGEHDFTRFCRPEGKSATIVLDSIDVHHSDDLITLEFSARFFLWNMVRRISAAIMSVGKGESSIADVKSALDGKEITFGLARPDALTLLDVHYKDVEFVAPREDAFVRRAEEEIFKERLRSKFFASL